MASAQGGGGGRGARVILTAEQLGFREGLWLMELHFCWTGWREGSKKSDFILVGFILVKLWQKAEDDKGGFKAFNPLSNLFAFNLHGHT